MKYYFVTLLLILNSFCLADSSTLQTPPVKLDKPLPSLGSCDEYTDYFIYQCIPFKCKLPVAGRPGVSREMQNLGFKDNSDLCVHHVNVYVRHEKFKPANFYYHCNLSEKGRLVMANLFTRYKKGDVQVYQDRPNNEVLNKECF